MPNESPNNFPHWRSKLDALEHLPDSSFDNDAAWDKLYGRLSGNKTTKKITWYWIAAACLLFGVIITILNYNKDNKQRDKETVIKQPKQAAQPDLKTEEITKNENSSERVTDKMISTSDKPAQRKRHITRAEVATGVHHDDVVTGYHENEPMAKPLQITSTNSTAAGVAPKKKLNVVHINELGDPLIVPSEITRIGDMRSFPLRFGNGEVLSNGPMASKSSGIIILKAQPPSN